MDAGGCEGIRRPPGGGRDPPTYTPPREDGYALRCSRVLRSIDRRSCFSPFLFCRGTDENLCNLVVLPFLQLVTCAAFYCCTPSNAPAMKLSSRWGASRHHFYLPPWLPSIVLGGYCSSLLRQVYAAGIDDRGAQFTLSVSHHQYDFAFRSGQLVPDSGAALWCNSI